MTNNDRDIIITWLGTTKEKVLTEISLAARRKDEAELDDLILIRTWIDRQKHQLLNHETLTERGKEGDG